MRPDRRKCTDFQRAAAPFETKPIPFSGSDNRMRAAVILAGGLLVAAAVAAFVSSAVPLDVWKARLDAMAPDGTADEFPLERIAGIVWKLRLFGILALGSAALCWPSAGGQSCWPVTDMPSRQWASRGRYRWSSRESSPCSPRSGVPRVSWRLGFSDSRCA
jgi:hypothetical protein